MAKMPIHHLLDLVEWRCTRCNTLLREGCHCWDRITAEEKAALADDVRMYLRHYIRTMYPEVWTAMSRSARQSIPNAVYNAVHAALGTLDPPCFGYDGDGS